MNKYVFVWTAVLVLLYLTILVFSRGGVPVSEPATYTSTSSPFVTSTDVTVPAPYSFSESARLGNTPLMIARIVKKSDLERGLSGQTELVEGTGLLFIFDSVDTYGIWMKDMNFPIDVVWLDSNQSVVSIKSNFLPSSYPEVAYGAQNTLYVLELPMGFLNTHHISIGDKLLF